jgi:hypothetical protein
MKVKQLEAAYAIWPGQKLSEKIAPMITMGIADGDSKRKALLEMGMSLQAVESNLIGNRYN